MLIWKTGTTPKRCC